jgi:hypothetical protein
MQQEKNTTRKKFVLWSLGALASVSAFKFFIGKKNEKKKTIKMLTQDGKLVEIDNELLKTSTERITNEELKNWVKK